MIIILLQGISACLISLGLRYIYIFANKNNKDMKKRCTYMVNGTFVTFAEKEIRSHFDTNPSKYDKYFFPIYEYYVNAKRYEIQSNHGTRRADESLIKTNIIVYYNPNKIEESFIKNENLNEAFKSLKILKMVFLIIGILLIVLYFILRAIV